MPNPALRALTESGHTWEDPSEDLLFALLGDLEAGEEEFVIVERTSDETGQTYAQVCRTDDGLYQVEHREGGASRHFQAFASDKQTVHNVITAWAFNLPGWRDALPWTPLDLSG